MEISHAVNAKSMEISHAATETLQIFEPVIQFWEAAKQNCLKFFMHLL